jgi:hypothetical protein
MAGKDRIYFLLGGQSEFMVALLPEIHIQILSHLDLHEILPARLVCKTLKNRIDAMLKAEFEIMHLKNFIALKTKMEGIGGEGLAEGMRGGYEA